MKHAMRAALGGILALALAAHMPARAEEADVAALSQQAQKILKGFAMTLKGTLVQALKSEGPVEAINVCSHKAGKIARNFSFNGWTVGRTALKLRNPMQNSPDEWEKAVLHAFEKQIAEGADPKTLVKAEIVEEGGKKVFRFMKAIPVGKPCLTCHGENLKPEVKEAIDALYPDDKATGFKLGQLRGAFTLKKPLN